MTQMDYKVIDRYMKTVKDPAIWARLNNLKNKWIAEDNNAA